MTINQGPRPIGSPRAEAVNQYAHQTQEMSERIRIGAMDRGPVPLILEGEYFVELDLVDILESAARAEANDPEPQCGAPVGPRHCVKKWRHAGAHWILED